MSCFSCFSSNKRRCFEDGSEIARPVRDISYEEKISMSRIDKTIIDNEKVEIAEVTTLDKEVDVHISHDDYDSEDDDRESLHLDVEKHLEMQKRIYRRSVLPASLRKKKASKDIPRVVTHGTGEEHQKRLTSDRAISMIADPNERAGAALTEQRRRLRWEQDRQRS